MPSCVRTNVGPVGSIAVSTQYLMGSSFTTQSVPLQNEFVSGAGTMEVSVAVVKFSASLAKTFVPFVAVVPKEIETFDAPDAVAAAVRIAVVICVPEVVTWMNTTCEPLVNPPPAAEPEMSCACVDGATGEMSMVPPPAGEVSAGVAQLTVPGAT